MRKLGIIAFLLISLSAWKPVKQPQKITWEILKDVQFKDQYSTEIDAFFQQPIFGNKVLQYDREEVYIKGYMIPVDIKHDFYVLSANPYSTCYFCGGGGPESVIELELGKDHPEYHTDDRLTFKGRLILNEDDPNRMNYILENAVEYTP